MVATFAPDPEEETCEGKDKRNADGATDNHSQVAVSAV